MGLINFLKNDIFKKIKSIFVENYDFNEVFEKTEEILISADVGIKTTEFLIDNIKKKITKNNISDIDKILLEEIEKIMNSVYSEDEKINKDNLHVFIVVGVNGAGKTTTIAKLANKYKKEGFNVLVGAADTFRAAAVDQMQTWCKKIGVKMFCNKESKDPSSVVFETIDMAKKNNYNIAIIDTAGRQQNKENLMNELGKMYKVALKHINKQFVNIILVLDGHSGQNVFSQIENFKKISENLEIKNLGIIVSKMDGFSKSGFIIGIYNQYKIPIKYIGTGEKENDLLKFNKNDFIKTLLGQND